MAVFLHEILYLNIKTTFCFWNKLWCVMKSGYFTIMWNESIHREGKMNHHQPHQRPVFFQRRWCCICGGIGRESSLKGVPSRKLNANSNKYCSLLDQLKTALNEKHSELTQRKCIIFHQDTTRCLFLWWPGKNCYSLAGRFWFICYTHQTLHLRISIYFSLTILF